MGRQSLIFLLIELKTLGGVKKWDEDNFHNLQIVNIHMISLKI